MPTPRDALREFSTVILTGGSSGIGKSFIEHIGNLHPAAFICNLSRRSPELPEGQLKLRHIGCDLSDSAAIERASAQVEELLKNESPEGRVLLVNNSGFGSYGAFPQPDDATQIGIVDVNVRAVVQLTARLLPLLKARGGAVMTVASTAAFQPTPWMATYGATKAFVLHWSLALNEELRGSGVRTLAVCPGPTATDFFRRAGLRQGSVPPAVSQSAGEVVAEALSALGARRAQVVTGWKNRLLVLGSALVSKPLSARLAGAIIKSYRAKHNAPRSEG
jgi:short-subunit dehydrogenase